MTESSSDNGSTGTPPTSVRVPLKNCPICQRPAEPRYRPFCSKRCADVDLSRWLTGGYRVESDEQPESFEGEIER